MMLCLLEGFFLRLKNVSILQAQQHLFFLHIILDISDEIGIFFVLP